MNIDWKSVKSQWEQMCLKSRLKQREGGGTSPNVNRQKAARAQWAWERPPKVIPVSSGDRHRETWSLGPSQPPRGKVVEMSYFCPMLCCSHSQFSSSKYNQNINRPECSGCCGQLSHSQCNLKAVNENDWALTRRERVNWITQIYNPPLPPTRSCPPT